MDPMSLLVLNPYNDVEEGMPSKKNTPQKLFCFILTQMLLFDMSVKRKFVPESYGTKRTHSFDAKESFVRPQTSASLKIDVATIAIPFGIFLFRFVIKKPLR